MNGAAVIQPSPIPFYTVLVLYLGIMAFIGWYAGRKTNSIGDFFVLSGKAGVLVSGISPPSFLWEPFLVHREPFMA